MTTFIFVRHAEPDHKNPDDRNRPLTSQGMKDTAFVLETLKNRKIDAFYCSPYLRSRQTIESTADYFGMTPVLDERLREREGGNTEGIETRCACDGLTSVSMSQAENPSAWYRREISWPSGRSSKKKKIKPW